LTNWRPRLQRKSCMVDCRPQKRKNAWYVMLWCHKKWIPMKICHGGGDFDVPKRCAAFECCVAYLL
jgi:hypothetical protein